ncbi:unnamed protein product [Macrosiphum euphorbiae]|uniref:HAT C-terminal dimerisation domain-containing protein n=1 Tax=Macrosiphum euphorbiae TaxID=13131 RepID=A0AAV0XVS8_9HEMI|nr:unnamed protein product [Macrosiphum euphorbiae]
MSVAKKRKIVDENRKYSEEWEEKHYETKHNDYLKFSSEVKQSKLREFTSQLKTQQKMFSSALQQPSNIVKASYSVSFLIAKKMKKFSDGEFVKECLEAVAKDILPDKNKLFSNISLSRQTVCRRINDISNEIIVKLRDRIQDFKYFSIAFDESTDISDTAQLVIFVRGVNESFQITEEMLKLISLKGTTKGEDIFHAVENNLDLEIISGISTDGAPAMVGKEKGAIKLLIDKIESTRKTNNFWKRDDLFIIHCLIHQQNLCSQVLSMNHVMQVVIETVNYIRSHALPHRQFKEFLKELDSEYGDVVYFSHVRWLSRGKCLKRFYELRHEIDLFMNDKQKPVLELSNDEWLLDLCFLVDIKKLLLFEFQLKNNNVQHFPLLNELKNSKHIDSIKYAQEIRKLIAAFESRFTNLDKYKKIFEVYSSPFHTDVNSAPEYLQMELIDLQCNNELKHIFETSKSKIDFYNINITKEHFPNLRNLAQKVVSAFGSTYTCESFFSKMKFAKDKSRTNLTDENLQHQLRCANTSISIDLKKLSERVEKQISH